MGYNRLPFAWLVGSCTVGGIKQGEFFRQGLSRCQWAKALSRGLLRATQIACRCMCFEQHGTPPGMYNSLSNVIPGIGHERETHVIFTEMIWIASR